MIDTILTAIAKISLLSCTIFFVLKARNKRKMIQNSLFNRRKIMLYHLHINGAKIALVASLIHGINRSGGRIEIVILGWIVFSIMTILTGFGGFLSIKHNSTPMTKEEDDRWRGIRNIKWVLSLLLLILLAFHSLL